MFAFFERLHRVAVPPKLPEAPPGALAFYWHSVADAKALFTGLFVAGFFVALIDAATPSSSAQSCRSSRRAARRTFSRNYGRRSH